MKNENKSTIRITGDTHGSFERIEEICNKYNTTKEDVIIIGGDAGINYGNPDIDALDKRFLQSLPITVFAIHGNHEERPYNIPTYKEIEWNGGTVYVEDEYPNILFAKDGEIYNLNGLKTLVIGGAYSADKHIRLARGYKWWPDEQPSEEIKAYVENQLDKAGWKVDVVLSHTCPLKYEPTEVFLPGIDQNKVDKSIEKWLDQIEERLNYKKWYCGHFHTEKKIDKLEFMFTNYKKFGM